MTDLPNDTRLAEIRVRAMAIDCGGYPSGETHLKMLVDDVPWLIARIDRVEATIHGAVAYRKAVEKMIAARDAEIEQLQTERDEYRAALYDLCAEIKRLAKREGLPLRVTISEDLEHKP